MPAVLHVKPQIEIMMGCLEMEVATERRAISTNRNTIAAARRLQIALEQSGKRSGMAKDAMTALGSIIATHQAAIGAHQEQMATTQAAISALNQYVAAGLASPDDVPSSSPLTDDIENYTTNFVAGSSGGLDPDTSVAAGALNGDPTPLLDPTLSGNVPAGRSSSIHACRPYRVPA